MTSTGAPFEVVDALRVSPDSFAQQMGWLAEAGYRSLTLGELRSAQEHRKAIPPKSVVITFDDGYQDFIDYAVPVLSRHGFTAHNFLVAGLVGHSSEWDYEQYGIRVPMFDWDAARSLEKQGFHCEAHSLTHADLGTLGETELRREIVDGRDRLQEELGREIEHFAYPYGSFNQQTREVLRETGFKTACSVRLGRSGASDDPYALRRICVHSSDSLFDFKVSVMTGYPVRKGLARRVGKVRTGSRSQNATSKRTST